MIKMQGVETTWFGIEQTKCQVLTDSAALKLLNLIVFNCDFKFSLFKSIYIISKQLKYFKYLKVKERMPV